MGTVVPAASARQRRVPLGRAPGPPSRADPTRALKGDTLCPFRSEGHTVEPYQKVFNRWRSEPHWRSDSFWPFFIKSKKLRLH